MRDLELPDFSTLPELPPLDRPERPFTRAEIMAKMAAAQDRYTAAGRLIEEAEAFIAMATVRREELHRQLWTLFHFSAYFTTYS